jgi:hypothetical protein
MLRRSARRGQAGVMATPTGSDFREAKPMMKKEVGMWLYKHPEMAAFHALCKKLNVKARGNVKITTTNQHARCLKATKAIAPGHAIITAPLEASFNFLVCSKQMYDVSNMFEHQITWQNWNRRMPFLHGASTAEFVTAGWMTRMLSRDDHGHWATYMKWLIDDTTGRDGVASGIARERGDACPALDSALSVMADDSGEDLTEFLENWYRALACLMLRSYPVDARVIGEQLAGTSFLRTTAGDLFVPTLIPLMDCVHITEVPIHNTMLDYHTAAELRADAALVDALGLAAKDVAPGVIGEKGMFSLRAMEALEPGDVLCHRSFPKMDPQGNETLDAIIHDNARLVNNAGQNGA